MIAAIAVLMAVIVILVNRQSIFQEGNPIPVLSGIWKLIIQKEPYACIKEEPPTYIARAGQYGEFFTYVDKAYGVAYKGIVQEASGERYKFEGGGKTVEMVKRHYTRSFAIWEIVEGASP